MNRRLHAQIAGMLVATAMIAVVGAPSTAALTPSTKLTPKCEKALTRLVSKLSTLPTGNDSAAYSKYMSACPKGPMVNIRALASNSRVAYKGLPGQAVGVKKVTSSNPRVVFLGPPVEADEQGTASTEFPEIVVGIGRSNVCVTWRDEQKTCTLVVVPKAITTANGGSAVGKPSPLVTGISLGSGSGFTVAELTSSNPAVLTVGTPPSSYGQVVGVGQTKICLKLTNGSGGCQTWNVLPS